jgi:hypothetical protein
MFYFDYDARPPRDESNGNSFGGVADPVDLYPNKKGTWLLNVLRGFGVAVILAAATAGPTIFFHTAQPRHAVADCLFFHTAQCR